MVQNNEPYGTEASVTQMTDEEVEEYFKYGSRPPSGVPEECECLYEYNPENWWSLLNKNLCCGHCLWLYENRKR